MKTKIISYCIVILLSTFNSFAQQWPARLIVRADDMGSSHASNVACIESYKNGIVTSIEIMAVGPWFPEAVRYLQENEGVDVGLHLAITSEWDNIKWRPLTQCPSLTDKNGYFLPMMSPNKNYPGLAITENKWKIDEIEKEFRAQIEMALQNIPRLSHISGHMGSLSFSKEVTEMVSRLASEYNLVAVDNDDMQKYHLSYSGYDGPANTSSEKEPSFLKMLDQLKPGNNYLFVDHPAYNNDEMKTVGHKGYENVATDRQGVTDLYTNKTVKNTISEKGIELISYNDLTKALPRNTDQIIKLKKVLNKYLEAVKKDSQDLHSIMILQHGQIITEKWLGEHSPTELHIMNSVTKTFTATAIGFAVKEGKLKLTDKVISFFPEYLPTNISDNLKEMEIKHLITMTCGHDVEPFEEVTKGTEPGSWEKAFLAAPVAHKPGTKFLYNSVGSYMLAAIVQKVTGEKVIDYLYPRLFRPLGITGVTWEMSPSAVNIGGWGLYMRTEDMAKMGQFILQKGKWNDKQLLPASWIEDASTAFTKQAPQWNTDPTKWKESDWVQGYGYQMWICRHNAFRADGKDGQFIIMVPEKDAVIITTANISDMQSELNLIWKYILPAL